LHDLGVTGNLLDGIQQALAPVSSDSILDAGCGEGFYLGSLHARIGFKACGIDISIPAAAAAAKRYAGCEWIVANADRSVPYADQSFSKVLSITARMNPGEFRRVLHKDGRLLVAVPSPADLVELRGTGRDRIERTVEIFSPCFQLLDQCRVATQADLDAAAINDILHSIYRPMQNRLLGAMSVTFSLDILIFRPTA